MKKKSSLGTVCPPIILTALFLLLLIFSPAVAGAGEYSLAAGGSGSGSLNEQNTRDRWQVVLPQDGVLTASVSGDATLIIDLYLKGGSDGSIQLASDTVGYASARAVTSPGLKAGTYYIEISRYNGYGGYTITTQFTAQPLANDSEPNDTRDQAQAIEPTGQSTGHLGYTDGNTTDTRDWWQVILPQDGVLTVSVNGDATLIIDLYLKGGSDGSILLASDTTGYASARAVTSPGLKAGAYYIDISRYNGYGGYTITTAFSPDGPAVSVDAPVFNPPGGTYTTAQQVSISTATPEATIRYTTDGTEPTGNSTIYKGPITVSSNTTIKAKAFKEGLTDSPTAGAVYMINTAPDPGSITLTNHWSTGSAFDFARGQVFSFWNGNPDNFSDDLEMVGGPPTPLLRGNLVDMGGKTLDELTAPPGAGYESDIPAVSGHAYWAKAGESYYKFLITGIDLTLDQNGNYTSMTFKYQKYTPSSGGDYQIWERKTVKSSHVFVITFNMDVDAQSINQNIYVKTAQGGDVITSLHQTQNDRITVMPHPDGYAPGDYTLYIEKGVRSTGGKTLKKAIKMEFTVTP